MPIYEYRCQDCDHQFDALQKMSDAVLTDCPNCKNAALIKLISAPAFRLSGSGWYETDFKTDKDKKKNLTDGGAAKGADRGASTATDKKPADKKASAAPKSDSAKKTSSGNSTSAGA